MGFFESELKFDQQEMIHAVVPLLKLLCLTVIGIILAHPRTKIVPKSTFKLLSKLVFALFLPCTIFIYLGQSVSVHNLALWWFIPVNVIISTIIGCILGLLVALICRPPPEFFRFTIIVTAFGNTGNLSMAIVGSVCRNAKNSFGPECHKTGTAYVSLAQWVSVLLVYTLVYHMMEPPMEYYEVVEEDEGGIEIVHEGLLINDLSRPLLHEAEWPGMGDKETVHCKTPFIARVFGNVSDFSETSLQDPESIVDGHERECEQARSPKSIRCLAEPRMVRKIRIVAEQTPVRHILQPPTIATLLALIIGMVPFMKSIVYDEDAPLSFLTDSLDIVAGAMVPSVLLVLGGMIAEGPNKSRLGIRTTIGILVARLLVLPMLGIRVVLLADKMNLLIQGDRMFQFVLLLQYTTPSAILFGAIASLRGYAVSEASALLFWQHVVALFSLSMYFVIYFKLLHM